MKVSINIPVYKCEKYISRCLESVKNQTYKNLEIILINDQTPDNSLEIVDKFIAENPTLNIKIIHHETNQGLSVVRNTGIENSTGKYLFFLDSDDEITPDCIELLINEIEEKNVEMVIAQNRWIDTRNNSMKDFGFPTNLTQKIYRNNESVFQAYSENKFPVVSWNKLISLDFIRENKIYFVPGLFAQDELWFFHLILKINSLSIIDDITYLYYLHPESVIFNRTKRNFENHQTIVEWFAKAYEESDSKRKNLIKKKIINFKETTLLMQWKSMRDEKNYWKKNYERLKKAPKLSVSEYFSNEFSNDLKKKNFFQNLPVELGFRLFKWRFERT
jgi:glycosyltransferase involved in cell wall biosynthesis